MLDLQEPKSKKPADTAFKQQRLPAWQPILTARNVMPIFFAVAAAFIPIGIGLLYLTNMVQEFTLDYTHCKSIDDPKQRSCADIIGSNRNMSCHCSIPFKLEEDFAPNVYMYYGLTNYYQNHRRYVKSRDDFQLLGKLSKTPSSDCAPYDYHNNKPIAPCGAIANSLFSDNLILMYSERIVPLLRTQIAWKSDKSIKYHNPEHSEGNLKEAFKDFEKPIDWRVNIWELDKENELNNGFENEDLIVWMRTAALPDFRKLYRRIDHSKEFKNGLPKGHYKLVIDYNYPVAGFGGTKSLILSNTSFTGGRNLFLGYAYIVVGCCCFLLGLLFLILHIKYKPSANTGDISVVSPSTSYQ
ncbi:cell cycle control protein 50A [Acyrthosiphon pisum]|uniref:Cell cycle control protein 50A n=1 Tax=Acyrthosiphon pisum TaxID=7029 RepID=A0A8R1ZZQ1_ACYPI|nr:cell cycle control protein 50A [Acyrthosiphon pisum]|eukprot:XP_001942963.2 PREDICTED: cell cycle control protein 50A [Acyrthosiphon pisum]